jgi:ribosomal protein S2
MAEEQELLVSVDQYSKAGIHIGTKFKAQHMADFIYKINNFIKPHMMMPSPTAKNLSLLLR